MSFAIKKGIKFDSIRNGVFMSIEKNIKLWLTSFSTVFKDNGSILPVTTLTEKENLFKEKVNKLARRDIQPLVKTMDEKMCLPDGYLENLFKNELMGMTIASNYGGSGFSFFMSLLAIEELSKVDPVTGLIVGINNAISTAVDRYGTEEQKIRFLPLLASKHIGSIPISEPEAGSNAFSMKTRAEKQGDYYIINGCKRMITNANIAGLYFVYANIDPLMGHKGITCFIVERGTPGLNIARSYENLGLKALPVCDLTFNNLKVSKDNILGSNGSGYKILISSLSDARMNTGAVMLGIAEECMDIAIPHTLSRKLSGQLLFDFQGLQNQIAKVETQIECARLLLYNSARKRENKQSIIKEAAMTKYFLSEVVQLATGMSIEWMGGLGFTKDYALEKLFRDAKTATIFEGTSLIQFNAIGNCIKTEYSS